MNLVTAVKVILVSSNSYVNKAWQAVNSSFRSTKKEQLESVAQVTSSFEEHESRTVSPASGTPISQGSFNPIKDNTMSENTETKTPKAPKEPNPYEPLSKNFFRGNFPGQIASIWKKREGSETADPAAIDAFKRAVADGKVVIPPADQLSAQAKSKLDTLGVSY